MLQHNNPVGKRFGITIQGATVLESSTDPCKQLKTAKRREHANASGSHPRIYWTVRSMAMANAEITALNFPDWPAESTLSETMEQSRHQMDLNGARSRLWATPYWLPVLVLTLLSGYLILSKPQKSWKRLSLPILRLLHVIKRPRLSKVTWDSTNPTGQQTWL